MKKNLIYIFILAYIINYAQCPAPSNLNLTNINLNDVELSWTENGTAAIWEIAVIPNFNIGDPLPINGYIQATINPFIVTQLPPGCNVFFVRSVCSQVTASPWLIKGSLACSTILNNYLATLTNENFVKNTESNELIISPNPATKYINLKSNAIIDKVTIFDVLGKIQFIQTQNLNQIDIENLSNGIYLMEVIVNNERIVKKLVKQ